MIVEPVTADTSACERSHVDGAALLGVDAEPASRGIRVHFDFCPGSGADCRCDVVVGDIGVDVAAELAPDPSVVVDLTMIPWPRYDIGEFIAITRTPTCTCATCACGEPLYLFAGYGFSHTGAPALARLGEGAEICPATPCTYGGLWNLHVATAQGEIDVPYGETRTLGAVRARAVSDVTIRSLCSSGPGDATFGSFALWSAR